MKTKAIPDVPNVKLNNENHDHKPGISKTVVIKVD